MTPNSPSGVGCNLRTVGAYCWSVPASTLGIMPSYCRLACQ